MIRPPSGDDWVALTDEPLPIAEMIAFVTLPSCGAVTLFLGTVRDHAEGRPNVSLVEYEAWPEQVERGFEGLVSEARKRWVELGRVAVLHRTGPLQVGEASVAVAVSSPHRAEAFDAGRWCIDTLKESAPIWKHEVWEGGTDWGLHTHPITPVGREERLEGM